jgi:hypothetical protein
MKEEAGVRHGHRHSIQPSLPGLVLPFAIPALARGVPGYFQSRLRRFVYGVFGDKRERGNFVAG